MKPPIDDRFKADFFGLYGHKGVVTNGQGYGNAYIVLKQAPEDGYLAEKEDVQLRNLMNSKSYDVEDAIVAADYLRSQGYNCGYLGYSPQELVEAGIVKYEH